MKTKGRLSFVHFANQCERKNDRNVDRAEPKKDWIRLYCNLKCIFTTTHKKERMVVLSNKFSERQFLFFLGLVKGYFFKLGVPSELVSFLLSNCAALEMINFFWFGTDKNIFDKQGVQTCAKGVQIWNRKR
jgi:hypothetical protein